MNKCEKTKEFIDKLGKQLIQYQKEGYLIIDNEDNIIKYIEQKGMDDKFGLKIDQVVYYWYNPDYNNGYHTSISEFKKIFSKFKVVKPEDIIKIKL